MEANNFISNRVERGITLGMCVERSIMSIVIYYYHLFEGKDDSILKMDKEWIRAEMRGNIPLIGMDSERSRAAIAKFWNRKGYWDPYFTGNVIEQAVRFHLEKVDYKIYWESVRHFGYVSKDFIEALCAGEDEDVELFLLKL